LVCSVKKERVALGVVILEALMQNPAALES